MVNIKAYPDNLKFEKLLADLADDAEEVGKQAVYAGAGVVASAVRKATPKDKRDLVNSLYTSTIATANDRTSNTVSYTGYDSKGAPNIVKARVLESKKRSFFKATVSGVRAIVRERMRQEVENRINGKMK